MTWMDGTVRAMPGAACRHVPACHTMICQSCKSTVPGVQPCQDAAFRFQPMQILRQISDLMVQTLSHPGIGMNMDVLSSGMAVWLRAKK